MWITRLRSSYLWRNTFAKLWSVKETGRQLLSPQQISSSTTWILYWTIPNRSFAPSLSLQSPSAAHSPEESAATHQNYEDWGEAEMSSLLLSNTPDLSEWRLWTFYCNLKYLKQPSFQPQPNQLYPENMNLILFTYWREMRNRGDYASS